MPGVAGHSATLKATGTSTAFTAAAFSGSGAGPYTISDATKGVWDPDTVPTFYDNGVAISTGDISTIDYLFGAVTFTGAKTGPITADGAYFPVYTVTGCREASLSFKRELLDKTTFDSAGAREYLYGLLSWSATVGHIDTGRTDLDSSGDTLTLHAWLLSAELHLLEIDLTGAGDDRFRGWFHVESIDSGGSVTGLLTGSLTLTGTARADSAGRPVSCSVG